MERIRRTVLHIAILLLLGTTGLAAQSLAVKTNLLTDALLVPSLGAELALGDRLTANLQATYCPFSVDDDHKWKNWSVQPELRYWFQHALGGPYVGVNAVVGGYNNNKVRVFGLYDRQRQGTLAGGGLSLGYHYILSTRLSLEFALGADYVVCRYDRVLDGVKQDRRTSRRLLPTGTALNLVYILR